MASKRVRDLADACRAELEYFPVLLGGLYEGTKAPQGKDGSATDVMAPVKQKYLAEDFQRERERWGVTLKWNPKHPVRSVQAQRLLAGIREQKKRAKVTDELFSLYWQQEGDVSDESALRAIARKNEVSVEEIDRALADKEALKRNTDWAVQRGVFGVPTFFVTVNGQVDDRFWFGGDRMFLVAHRLGVPKDHRLGRPLRLFPSNVQSSYRPKLEWFHDFSSPWSYLSATQVERIAQEHNAILVPRPILLGALFKGIGTPNVPMFAMSEAKRAYGAVDMEDWKTWWGGISLTFPQGFPIRTVNPLRVSIAEPKVIPVLYKAAWVDGLNIGEDAILADVLSKNRFDAASLLKRAKDDPTLKEELIRNTNEAMKRGICGVPTFSVDDGPIVWGQDRFNIVEDDIEAAKQRKSGAKL